MWGFVLLAGTFGWLTLFKIIRSDTEPVPDRNKYSVVESEEMLDTSSEHQKCNQKCKDRRKCKKYHGVYEETTSQPWTAQKGQGRRQWCGDVLSGLPRAERQDVLRLMREQLLYVRWLRGDEATWKHIYRFFRWYTPVCYLFADVSPRVRERLFGPVAWVGFEVLERNTMTVSFDEWARCVEVWYTEGTKPKEQKM